MRRAWVSAWVALLVFGLGMAGCNIVAPVAYVLGPEPTVEASHNIKDKPTIVFVDDRQGRVSPARLVRVMADETSEALLDEEVITTVYRPADALAFVKQQDRFDKVASNNAIAKAVGADQLIYVEVMRFDLVSDGYSAKPRAILNVKVVDVEDKSVVYPDPATGQRFHQVVAELSMVDVERYRSLSGRAQMSEELAVESGQAVARLFYEYQPRKLGGQLGDR